MKKLIIALVVLIVPALAQAQITNGRFETGDFSGWETIGDALVVDTSSSNSPGRGTYQALITNAPDFCIPAPPYCSHPQSYSGYDSVGSFGVAFFIGLDGGFPPPLWEFAFSLGHQMPWEGSAIKQTFTADAGSILTFNWQYLTDETLYLTCCKDVLIDFAFVVLDGNILFLADNTAVHHDSDTPFIDESGYRTFVVRLATGGTHTIGIGVVDTYDGAGNSGILLDNFRIVNGSSFQGVN